jgi:hypothetical protein
MDITVARGWVGDTSTQVVGRLPNELLFYVERWALPIPASRRMIKLAGDDDYWYPDIRVWNLGHDTDPGIVTGFQQYGYNVLACRIAAVHGDRPWKPGVHLFSVEWNNFPDASSFNTIATAVIDSSLKVLNNGRLGHPVNLLAEMLKPRSVLVGGP